MHSRNSPTKLFPIKDLKLDRAHIPDTEYIRLSQKVLTGKIKVALTRMHTTNIVSGYFSRKPDGTVSHVQNLKERFVPPIMQGIRAGTRYTIDVYWSQHVPKAGGYVCPDDEVMLEAYRRLGIEIVPCRILKPNPIKARHASLWLETQKKRIRLSKEVPPDVASVPIFSFEPERSFRQTTQRRIESCKKLQAEIRNFHKDGDQAINYHHFLHAALGQHCDALDTISNLLVQGRAQHALSICRMSYEAYLNFHIDWLAPEFIGPRRQLHAALGNVKDHQSKRTAERALANFPDFFRSTSRKARVSPLPDLYHEVVYSSLSSVVHQTYDHIEGQSSSFQKVDDLLDASGERELRKWLDMLTASFMVLISNEIGKPMVGIAPD